jgi:alanyl aminopeptidase
MGSFIDRPGIPLVSVSSSCEQGQPASLTLSQRRYLPIGSKATDDGKPWLIPVCLRLSHADGSTASRCTLLTESSATLELDQCPVAVHPNEHERSYYQWSLDQPLLDALIAPASLKTLDKAELLGLFIRLKALINLQGPQDEARIQQMVHIWNILLQMSRQNVSFVQLQIRAVRLLNAMEIAVQRSQLEPSWKTVLTRELGPTLTSLTLETVAGEDPLLTELRTTLIWILANLADDPYVIAQATSQLTPFLKDPESIPQARASWAIPIAAQRGDALLWDALLQIVKTTQSPAVRNIALSSLGNFLDPTLQQRSLDLILHEDVRSNEMWNLYGPMMRRPDTNLIAWTWFKANYQALVLKQGDKAAPRLPGVAGAFCTRQEHDEAAAFFRSLTAPPDGMERNLSQTLERILACDEITQRRLEPTKRFLQARLADYARQDQLNQPVKPKKKR